LNKINSIHYSEIDKRSKVFIDRLREAVEIPSVSAEEKHRQDVFKMIDWAEEVFISMNF
jgi:hypothetical protein